MGSGSIAVSDSQRADLPPTASSIESLREEDCGETTSRPTLLETRLARFYSSKRSQAKASVAVHATTVTTSTSISNSTVSADTTVQPLQVLGRVPAAASSFTPHKFPLGNKVIIRHSCLGNGIVLKIEDNILVGLKAKFYVDKGCTNTKESLTVGEIVYPNQKSKWKRKIWRRLIQSDNRILMKLGKFRLVRVIHANNGYYKNDTIEEDRINKDMEGDKDMCYLPESTKKSLEEWLKRRTSYAWDGSGSPKKVAEKTWSYDVVAGSTGNHTDVFHYEFEAVERRRLCSSPPTRAEHLGQRFRRLTEYQLRTDAEPDREAH